MDSIFHRISVRRYEDKHVEKEKLMQILRAGMQAPSACNQQPWEFYVVTNPEKIKLTKIQMLGWEVSNSHVPCRELPVGARQKEKRAAN